MKGFFGLRVGAALEWLESCRTRAAFMACSALTRMDAAASGVRATGSYLLARALVQAALPAFVG